MSAMTFKKLAIINKFSTARKYTLICVSLSFKHAIFVNSPKKCTKEGIKI